jgi:hypothetical protein
VHLDSPPLLSSHDEHAPACVPSPPCAEQRASFPALLFALFLMPPITPEELLNYTRNNTKEMKKKMAASPLKLELSRKQTQIDQYKEQASMDSTPERK